MNMLLWAIGYASILKAVNKQKEYKNKVFIHGLFEKYGFTSHAEKKKLSILGEKMMHESI